MNLISNEVCRKKSWRTNSLNEYSFSSAINRFILFKLIRILKLILYTPTHFLLMHSKKIKSLFKHSVWKYIVKYSLNYVYDFNNLEETKFIFIILQPSIDQFLYYYQLKGHHYWTWNSRVSRKDKKAVIKPFKSFIIVFCRNQD